MFSGKDLAGWKVYPDSTAVVTPQGWIHLTGGKGQVESQSRFADFTLQLEAMVNGDHLNSGVFFRSIPGEMWNGYESQIQNGFRDGDRTKPIDCGTGGIYRRQSRATSSPTTTSGSPRRFMPTGPIWPSGSTDIR